MSFDISSCFDSDRRPHVLLQLKRTRFSLYNAKAQYKERIKKLTGEDALLLEPLLKEHDAHESCVAYTKDVLKNMGAVVHFRYPRALKYPRIKPIIVSIGGDGTVLSASHRAQENPIFGVNSDPQRSVGAMCLATQESFSRLFSQFLAGHMSIQAINRIAVTINGQKQSYYALNEILIAHANTAASSRYILRVGAKHEVQLSSGIWIATAAGSTGAMNSAGGLFCPLDDQRLQFAVREPCYFWGQRPTLINGLFDDKTVVEITSNMPKGRIFFDGPYKWANFPIGDTLRVFNAPPALLVVDEKLEKRRKHLAQLRVSTINTEE